MREEDLIIGEKYTPLRKTIGDFNLFTKPWGEWPKAQARYQPFLYLRDISTDDNKKRYCELGADKDYGDTDSYHFDDIIAFGKYYPDRKFLKDVWDKSDEKQRLVLINQYPFLKLYE